MDSVLKAFGFHKNWAGEEEVKMYDLGLFSPEDGVDLSSCFLDV